MHDKCQEKTCILPITIDKEDEENIVPNLKVHGGMHQVGKLEMADSHDVPEREEEVDKVEEPQPPLQRSSQVRKKISRYANLVLTKDIGT